MQLIVTAPFLGICNVASYTDMKFEPFIILPSKDNKSALKKKAPKANIQKNVPLKLFLKMQSHTRGKWMTIYIVHSVYGTTPHHFLLRGNESDFMDGINDCVKASFMNTISHRDSRTNNNHCIVFAINQPLTKS